MIAPNNYNVWETPLKLENVAWKVRERENTGHITLGKCQQEYGWENHVSKILVGWYQNISLKLISICI